MRQISSWTLFYIGKLTRPYLLFLLGFPMSHHTGPFPVEPRLLLHEFPSFLFHWHIPVFKWLSGELSSDFGLVINRY